MSRTRVILLDLADLEPADADLVADAEAADVGLEVEGDEVGDGAVADPGEALDADDDAEDEGDAADHQQAGAEGGAVFGHGYTFNGLCRPLLFSARLSSRASTWGLGKLSRHAGAAEQAAVSSPIGLAVSRIAYSEITRLCDGRGSGR